MSIREPRPANGITNGVNGINGVHESKKEPVFDPVEDSIEAFARGEFVVVLDSADRENEGDLIIAAEHLTTEKMAFMIRYTSGYICAPVTAERAAKLDLPAMVANNADPNRTAYTVTVDAVGPNTTTGISAEDRAFTLRALASPDATAASFRRPGHVVPLQARDGGIRARYGHTEAGVELCRLAGKQPAAALCEMILDGEPIPGKAAFSGGRMMRRDDCLEFGRRWGLKVITIEDLVAYVEAKEGKLDEPGANY